MYGYGLVWFIHVPGVNITIHSPLGKPREKIGGSIRRGKKKKKVDAMPHARSLQYAFQLTMHSNALRRLAAFKGFLKVQPPSLPQWIQLL